MSYKQQLQDRINELNKRLIVSRNNREQHDKLSKQRDEVSLKLNMSEMETTQLENTVKLLSEYRVKKKKLDSNQITDTVTSIANLVFPEYPYTYFLDGKLNGDYTHTELAFRDNRGYEYVPSISNGNGLQQVVSLSSIAVLMALSDVTPTLLLDERLNSVSPDRLPIVGEVLEQFTKYGFQILIIEHPDALFDHINYTEIRLDNINGETVISSTQEINNKIME